MIGQLLDMVSWQDPEACGKSEMQKDTAGIKEQNIYRSFSVYLFYIALCCGQTQDLMLTKQVFEYWTT